MNAKEKKRQWCIAHGLVKPSQRESHLNKTEGGTRFTFPVRMFTDFTKWSSEQRDQNRTPRFIDYYRQLSAEDQATVTITNL